MTRPTAPPSKRREGKVRAWLCARIWADGQHGVSVLSTASERHAKRTRIAQRTYGVVCGPIVACLLPKPVSRRKGKK